MQPLPHFKCRPAWVDNRIRERVERRNAAGSQGSRRSQGHPEPGLQWSLRMSTWLIAKWFFFPRWLSALAGEVGKTPYPSWQSIKNLRMRAQRCYGVKEPGPKVPTTACLSLSILWTTYWGGGQKWNYCKVIPGVRTQALTREDHLKPVRFKCTFTLEGRCCFFLAIGLWLSLAAPVGTFTLLLISKC